MREEPAATSPRTETKSTPADVPRGAVQRTIGWIFVGTAGALVATGVVGYFARQSAVNAYNDEPTCPGFGAVTQPPACQDHISTANTWQTISIVSLIAGGALAVAGAVLLVLNR